MNFRNFQKIWFGFFIQLHFNFFGLFNSKTSLAEEQYRLIKSKKMASSWQRKEAEGTLQKQLPTPTTPMTVILANAPTQAETLLHSLEWATADISLHVNAHKTEYLRFNQTSDISTLGGSFLKLVDKFTYLGSSVSSTEKDSDTQLTKA